MTSTDEFRNDLFKSGILRDGGSLGLYHRSSTFESIARGVESYLSVAGRSEVSRRLYFSHVIALSTLEGSGYVSSFPNLIGTINSFDGGEAQLSDLRERLGRHEAWIGAMLPTEVGLCSAACHGAYPLAATEPLPAEGWRWQVQANCFRHEPSPDPARMQSFRQHEFLYIGTADGAVEHRDRWLQRGAELLSALGLSLEIEEANDPFFGRGGRLMAAGQREKALKFEIMAPISSAKPGAVSSANCHEDHFGVAFGITLADGSPAHSACIGFGLERITLALLLRHGLEVDEWPAEVREQLSLPLDLKANGSI